ncbi:MAG: ATP-binding protein [Polyangiaceae bacterium]
MPSRNPSLRIEDDACAAPRHASTGILRGIRSIHQLLRRERDPRALLQQVCEILVEARGFPAALAVEPVEAGRVSLIGGAGLLGELGALHKTLAAGIWPEELDNARLSFRVQSAHEPLPNGAPAKDAVVAIARLTSEGRSFGALFVALPVEAVADDDELALLGDLACDVACALREIEVEAENEAADSERRYRALFANTNLAVAYCTLEFDAADRPVDVLVVDANPSFSRLTGLKDVVGKRMSEIIPGVHESDPAVLETYARVVRTGRPERHEVYRHALRMWFDVSLCATGSNQFVAVFDNITGRKRIEDELMRNQSLLGSFFESPGTMRAVLELDGDRVVPIAINAESVAFASTDARRLLEDGALFLGGGETARLVTAAKLALSIGSAVTYECHAGPRWANKWFALTVSSAGTSENGNPRIALEANDISERKNAEEQLLRVQAELHAAQRLEATGRLAGGVAHDFNNLLAVILSYGELAMADLGEENPVRADLLEIRRAGERAAMVTRQLLAFSAKQVLTQSMLDMNQVIAGFEQMLRRLLGSNIGLDLALAPHLDPVRADQGQIEQVLMHLAMNAREAMPSGGRLTIATANVELDEQAVREPGFAGGPFVVITVSDTGVGMDATTAQHVFEPFFTTKHKSEGAGLGLSAAHGIVRQSGGFIHVLSERGRGSTFEVYLPRAAPAEPVVVQTAPFTARDGECVLIVEGDAIMRRLTERILARAGYEVHSAVNVDGALALCEGESVRPFDLLLFDPLSTVGTQALLTVLERRWPRMRVLHMQALSSSHAPHIAEGAPATPSIRKPFGAIDLTRKVREILDAAS